MRVNEITEEEIKAQWMGYWLANNLNRQRMSKKDREHAVNELERNIRIAEEETPSSPRDR